MADADNGVTPVPESERQISDPIVITLTYIQSLQGPTIRVVCDQEVWPDVLVDILQRAARFQERELIVERLVSQQFAQQRAEAIARTNAAGQLMKHLKSRKN